MLLQLVAPIRTRVVGAIRTQENQLYPAFMVLRRVDRALSTGGAAAAAIVEASSTDEHLVEMWAARP